MNDLTGEQISNIDFRLHINGDVYDKVMHWVRQKDTEISGYGTVEFDAATKTFRVVEASLLDVSHSSSETTIDPVMAGKYFSNNRNNGAGKWHWHSHPTFGAFWSGTDKSLIRGLGQNQPYLTATVFNQKAECKSAFYQMTRVMGLQHEIFLEDIPTSILRVKDDELIRSWNAEMEGVEQFLEKQRPATNYRTIDTFRDWERERAMGKQWDRPPVTSNYHRRGYLSSNTQEGLPLLTNRSMYQGIGMNEFDDEGWGYFDEINKSLYNPCKDRELRARGDEAVWTECVALEKDEFQYLYQKDATFRLFIDDAFNEGEIRELMK